MKPEVMMGKNYDDTRKSSLQERVDILHNQGYRGYSPSSSSKKWDGVEISVADKNGTILTAEGETPEEAYQSVIEMIDYKLDDIS